MLLPILEYKDQIITAVLNHPITIVSAETGSGKSTQIPQFLSKYYDQVIVTEPRIMAAKTLAKRVSEEMGVTLGNEVGYRTGYDKCDSINSQIVYCTDGLQLIRTICSKDNETERVLVIDEVHEWNINIETLIAWCKFMQGKWNTKVVIMSATLDAEKLANFFDEDVAVLSIPGNLYDVTVEERSEYEFIYTIKEYIHQRKNILVFVAGKKEIGEVVEELKYENATVLPLHGEMDWEEQRRCFLHYPNSKVIVATNIAQTSVTIPDIDVVVDSGEAKISIAKNGIQGLYLVDISKADIMQRKGRAGRTKNGKYILCSNTPIRYRDEYTLPEIQRSILDRVVLQIAEIGLDAEELEFYHQPDTSAILRAKKELVAIGALSNNKVTDLGHKIVRIPVSVQSARMIIEAEKYGVTEQVMIITAIIEMGGLLDKNTSYCQFTSEWKSDLLAELDVWNSINKMGYIDDFEEIGIRKKNFFNIKQHIKKLKEALNGIVEMSNNGDRDAVLKSCLCGLVSHIYVRDSDKLRNNDGLVAILDRKSCISEYSRIVVGKPYGGIAYVDILRLASTIDAQTLFELVPNSIKEETSLRYSKGLDAIEVTTTKSFAGVVVNTQISYDKNHPQYSELKAKYEEDAKLYSNPADNPANHQSIIVINGKQFEIYKSYLHNCYEVYLDEETLFTTNVNEFVLDNGEKVQFKVSLSSTANTSILALKRATEFQYMRRIRERKVKEYSALQVLSIDDVINNADKLGKINLGMNNGGYGETPILAYGYIALSKNTVTFKLGDDEQTANDNTLEALQYLFIKRVEKMYSPSKFSHQTGKKRKNLTETETKLKEDFYSLVREMMPTLTVENATENLAFLEEYYQELMQ